MDVRVVRRRFERAQPPGAPRGRRSRDGPPQLRDHGPALGRVGGADRNGDERQAEGRLLAHPRKGGMGTGRDLRRGPERRHRGPQGPGRRRDGPGPWWSRLRQVADPPRPRRRVPAVDGPDCDRRRPQPIRGPHGAPEARGRRRATLPKRSPRTSPGAEAMSHTGAVTDHAQRGTNLASIHRVGRSVPSGRRQRMTSSAGLFRAVTAAEARRQEVTFVVQDDGPVGLDGVRVKFDDERVVSDAGLMLLATLAARLGIEECAQRFVRLPPKRPGAGNAGRKVLSLIFAMALGADSIDDCDVLRSGRTRRLLGGWVAAPATLGTFLRAFTFGHVRQLDRLLGEALTRAWRAGAGPATGGW